MTRALTGTDYAIAAAIALGLLLLYNANGREIASYDSQPSKFAARELLLRRTLSLNHVVGVTPELADRSGFQLARDGNYRSAYSPVPSIAAALLMWPFSTMGVIDLESPFAPSLISAVASSVIVAAALALTFLTARRWLSRARAAALALALGAGTGWWTTASQTLWQHETAIFGLTLAVFGLCAISDPPAVGIPGEERSRRWMLGVLIGIGLGLAMGSRQQLAPAVAVLGAATFVRGGRGCAAWMLAAAAALVLPVWVVNVRWFGTIFGAAPMLEALHESIHDTTGSFSMYSGGFSGLLLSPNRGLLIFSPVVAIVGAGVSGVLRSSGSSPMRWCSAAAVLQFGLYASYVVWWGGHTFGPRYMLDVLPLLVPAGILAVDRIKGRLAASVAVLTLAWSIGVAALGAFTYPHERWNTTPTDVDRDHGRLWDWSDTQIRRALGAGLSPQNFRLLPRDRVAEEGR